MNVVSLFPEPPHELNEAAADLWRELITCRARSWWTDTRLEALADYCRAAVRSRAINAEAERMTPEQELDRWLSIVDVSCGLTDQLIDAHERAFGP